MQVLALYIMPVDSPSSVAIFARKLLGFKNHKPSCLIIYYRLIYVLMSRSPFTLFLMRWKAWSTVTWSQHFLCSFNQKTLPVFLPKIAWTISLALNQKLILLGKNKPILWAFPFPPLILFLLSASSCLSILTYFTEWCSYHLSYWENHYVAQVNGMPPVSQIIRPVLEKDSRYIVPFWWMRYSVFCHLNAREIGVGLLAELRNCNCWRAFYASLQVCSTEETNISPTRACDVVCTFWSLQLLPCHIHM